MTIKVIGAGLPRTGTLSTQTALTQLGYKCYHMQELPRQTGHVEAWLDLVRGETMDWAAIFNGFNATVDAPGCFYYKELLQEYPDAKIILTVRNPDTWHRSLRSLMRTGNVLQPLARIVPRIGTFLQFGQELFDKFLYLGEDKEGYIDAYHRHVNGVIEFVPQDQLLVYEVKDGWGPLCQFLGHEIPEKPFPHLNKDDGLLSNRVRNMVLGRGLFD